LAQVVTAGTATTVSFSSIPATFTSLLIIGQASDTAASTSFATATLQFNADTAANYMWKYFGNIGAGASLASWTGSGGDAGQAVSASSIGCMQVPGTSNANAVAMTTIEIPNYAGTTFHKLVQSKTFGHNGATLATTTAINGYTMWGKWANTAAITSIVITKATTAFTNGSTFTLYGIP
jgi:hypothetical protein